MGLLKDIDEALRQLEEAKKDKAPAPTKHKVASKTAEEDPEVDKEGFIRLMAFLNERDGALDVIVHVHLGSGTIEGSIFIKPIITRKRCIRDHVIGQVPFTKVGSRVTCTFKEARQKRGLGVQPIGHVTPGVTGHPGEVPVNIVASWEMPGHDRCATGGTHATGSSEPVKISSFLCQTIDIRCFDIGMIMAT